MRVVCHATQAQVSAKRRWEALHEAAPWHNGTFDRWARERDNDHPFHRDDGVTIEVTTDGAELDDTWIRGVGQPAS